MTPNPLPANYDSRGDSPALARVMAESLARTRATDGWPYPQPGEPACSFEHPAGGRCVLRAGHDESGRPGPTRRHYSGPGTTVWTAPPSVRDL